MVSVSKIQVYNQQGQQLANFEIEFEEKKMSPILDEIQHCVLLKL